MFNLFVGERPRAALRLVPGGVTQGGIADALGLSAVHVNRTLKKLRVQRLVSTMGQSVTITDGEGLRIVAAFDPSYLHFRKEARC